MADGRAMLTDAIKYHENQIRGLSAAISRIDEIRLLEADIKTKQARLDKLKTPPADWKDPRKIPELQAALSRHPPGCDCSLCDGTDEIVKGLESVKSPFTDWKEPAKISEIVKDQKDAPLAFAKQDMDEWEVALKDNIDPKDKKKEEDESAIPSFWGHPSGCMCPHCYEARTKTKIPKGMQVCRLGGLCDDKYGKCECSPCS
jgi:hypothetical protein